MGNALGISKHEIGNLLEDLKTDLLNHMGKKIDTLYSHKKHEEVEKALVVYCPTCRKKHGLEDFSYNQTHVASLEEASYDLFLKE